MTSWTLALRSLRFHLRSHLGTIIGAAIATAVLTGALLVGDSVRGSLRRMALDRLGKIDHVLASGDRLFTEGLVQRVGQSLGENGAAVGVLQLLGTASNPDGDARANRVQIAGVEEDFWTLAPDSMTNAVIEENSVWINARLAEHLEVKEGETVLLRVPRVSHLSRDAPLSPEEDTTVALRLEVGRVLSDGEFGRFGLAASQVPPFNAFVRREFLQERVNAAGQLNLLLGASRDEADLPITQLQETFEEDFTLADGQYAFNVATNYAELRTKRVFIDPEISEAARAASTNALPIFTYFVNELRVGELATPYSMVTGAGAPLVPGDLEDDQMVVNQWLAEDLGLKAGDALSVRYYMMGVMRELIERTNVFYVHSIVPMEALYADATLMPDFPGMTDAENCRDWDTGFPIDTEAIRDKDEAYWDQYRGAPKAFVTLGAAQKLWSNRFGNLTSVRYSSEQAEEVKAKLEEMISPRTLGYVFEPAREQALAASAGAQDFGGLFIGFSFFLIAAALILMSLLFRFGLEQRGVEIGTLLSLGFQPKAVRRLLLLEGVGLAVIGGILGVAGAVLYSKAMLYGLSTIWQDAVASSTLGYYGNPVTLLAGFVSGVVVALVTIWWSLRKEAGKPARELLNEGFASEELGAAAGMRKTGKFALVLGVVCLVLGLGVTGWGLAQREQARPDLFFGAGALILVAGLALSSAFIRKLEFSTVAQHLSVTGMGVRSITRRRKRSRATIMLLACGAFLIASIGAFRLDAGKDAGERSSGTGGFALIGETAIPVVHNLNSSSGREFFGLDEGDVKDVSFVPFRLLEGEDASCLNLNRAQRPRLLGVDPTQLSERDAFTFTKVMEGFPEENPWSLLEQDLGEDVVPAIGDAASIQWALGKKIGDTLIYLDGNGQEFEIQIVGAVANSILQGNLVISEKHFVARFPTEAGYKMFLIDAPRGGLESLSGRLSRALQDVGLEVTSAQGRLAEFNAVQNTYLGTFQLLGGLGLLLGSFGLGVVLLRNIFERRSELALLLAVGFRKKALRWLVLSEHAALLVMGLFIGVIAAVIAILPAIITPGRDLPSAHLALTLGGVLVCGLVFTVVAAAFALKAPLLNALRNE